MKMIACKATRYAGKVIAPDTEFEASDRDAKILATVGLARPIAEATAAAAKPGRYQRRDLRARA